jgi:protoporphyrinogen oxidase
VSTISTEVQIGADWAAQRIKGLSLGEVIRTAVLGKSKDKVVKTLIDEFLYPEYGPGQLWDACADAVVSNGWEIKRQTRVTGVQIEGEKVVGIVACGSSGEEIRLPCDEVLSSMPLRDLIRSVSPSAPFDVLSSAEDLKYRDFLMVSLVLDSESLFPDNWLYVHSPEVRLGRIQNFKNWSRSMVPDSSKTCLGLEYFVNEGDDLWTSSDEALVELGYRELSHIGLADGDLLRGYVVRMPKAYPIYDPGYLERLDTLRSWLSSISGLYCMGRNGQHRYNNMDHSMMTALIAARDVALGDSRDPWAVNEDAEYHEISKAA